MNETSSPYIINFSVRGVLESRYKVVIKTSTNHTIVSDEPPEFDGEGLGPNPIELFLASIAACTAITLKLHARRRGIEINRIEVEVKGSFDLRGFLKIPGVEPGLKNIDVNVKIYGNNKEELDELMNIVKETFIVGTSVIRGTPINMKHEVIVVGR